MTNKSIADIRINYSQKQLLEEDADRDPVQQFGKWWKEAVESEILEVNAMTLATASSDGIPAARIVLLKDFSEKGFVFFTNYESFKAQQLADNPKACLVFFWKELERQVRITGLVQQVPALESDEYFHSRPEGSRIGAITSPQSHVIESRQWLDDLYKKNTLLFSGKKIERPVYWGGYMVRPVVIEFWQGRPGRLHDRLQYTLQENNVWKLERLAP
ncbi:MAG: pyridoxamine 5'-phosphate oxidase [Sphingobacteriales bacterium]|nr:pyridoxamine 5'-phosphate oxidase [Sphingobacteriales bacterium]OJY85568.1 MAG: pyridoxamine 5'-phosphate oxidase [Sphingobacteriales bacterium 44-15]